MTKQKTEAAHRNTVEQLVRQTSALQAVVTWLEANGHDAENRKMYNGELHQHCYACRILDQCKAALPNNGITGGRVA